MTPHLRFPAISFAALERECARELEQRRATFRRQVERGRMLQAEADREIALASAWLEDVRRIRWCWQEQWSSSSAAIGPQGRPGSAPVTPEHGFSWKDRHAALLRELELRARFYPQWIAGGRLLESDAAAQVACLECLLAIYEDGWDWRGSDGLTPLHSPTADAEFNALQAARAARQGTAQKELTL